VRVYRIDKNHSDAYRYIKAGKPIQLSGAKLQMLSSYRRSVKNGAVDLPSTTLPASSVTLWMLTPATANKSADRKGT